jgi:hypothetical protein
MGWSCTKAAHDAMERLTDACVQASASQNRFAAGGRWFFWEHDPVEHDDGRITGRVIEELDFESCREHSEFVITHDGCLRGGHAWMRQAIGINTIGGR